MTLYSYKNNSFTICREVIKYRIIHDMITVGITYIYNLNTFFLIFDNKWKLN